MAIQTILLSQCKYDKAAQILTIPSSEISGGFPSMLLVASHMSSEIIKFEQDVEAAIAAEFWDGEQSEYRPVSACRVSKLVVFNN